MQGSDAELLLRAIANAAESLPEIHARHADYEWTERFFRDVTRQRALAKASRG
jgi:hypothetical protein